MNSENPRKLAPVLDGVCIGIGFGLWIAIMIDHYHPVAPYWWPNIRDSVLVILLPVIGAVPGAIYRRAKARFKTPETQAAPMSHA
jgi:hypothetical protein